MKKEFWLFNDFGTAFVYEYDPGDGAKYIHVIEKSAYNELKDRLDFINDVRQQNLEAFGKIVEKANEEIVQLKADLKIARDFAEDFTAKVLELKQQNAELQAKLYVAKDSQLRTYDGLADRADKYEKICARLETMIFENSELGKAYGGDGSLAGYALEIQKILEETK